MRYPDRAFDARTEVSRTERLSALLSLTSAAVAVLAFSVIALAVRRGLAAPFDATASWALHSFERPWLTALMVGISTLASPLGTIAITLAVGWVALRHYDARAGALGFVQLLASAAVNFALKLAFHRPRPQLFGGEENPVTFGFPSWHAMASVAVFGFLVLLLSRRFPRLRPGLGVGAVLLALLVGLSRIYLGMHWPTDVLAGYLAGWILLLAGAAMLERLPAKSP